MEFLLQVSITNIIIFYDISDHILYDLAAKQSHQ